MLPIFKNLNLLKLEDIYKLKVLKFYFNLIKGNLRSKFDVFCLNHSMGSNCYEIRDPKYTIPKFKHEFARKSFHYNLINIINNTPAIKDKACTHSIQGFVNYIKKYSIQPYNDVCLIDTCYVCLNAEWFYWLYWFI